MTFHHTHTMMHTNNVIFNLFALCDVQNKHAMEISPSNGYVYVQIYDISSHTYYHAHE